MPLPRTFPALSAVLLVAALAAPPVLAQTRRPAPAQSTEAQWAACDNLDGDHGPDAIIAGCNAVIQRGTGTSETLAAAYHNRGAAHRVKGDTDLAIADYNAALRLTPKDVDTLYIRGNAYASQHDYERAIADYDQAIKLDPEFAPAYNNRGGAYHMQRNYTRAIVDFDKAIALNDEYAAALANRCRARAALGQQLDLAQADCSKSLDLRPDDPSTLDTRGLVHLRGMEFSAAFDDYDAAYRLNDGQFGSLYGRGVAQLRLGRTDAGRADIAKATAHDPAVASLFAQSGITP